MATSLAWGDERVIELGRWPAWFLSAVLLASLLRQVVRGVGQRPAQPDAPLQACEGVGNSAPVLLAELGSRDSSLGHGHQRLRVPRFECELGLESERRAVQSRLSRRGQETSRAVNHLEHVVMPIKLVGRWSEVDS